MSALSRLAICSVLLSGAWQLPAQAAEDGGAAPVAGMNSVAAGANSFADGDEALRMLILAVTAAVVCLTLVAMAIVVIRRSRAGRRPGAGGPPRAFLDDPRGRSGRQRHELGRRPIMLGRVSGNERDQLQFITIPGDTIGRRHALIEYKDHAFWIADQDSVNGTFINGQPITSEMRLKHGDHIHLHQYELVFSEEERAGSGESVPAEERSAPRTDRDRGFNAV